jgi:hypothetical protein
LLLGWRLRDGRRLLELLWLLVVLLLALGLLITLVLVACSKVILSACSY